MPLCQQCKTELTCSILQRELDVGETSAFAECAAVRSLTGREYGVEPEVSYDDIDWTA